MFSNLNQNSSCDIVAFLLSFARKSKRSNTYKRHYRNIARHLTNFEKSRKIKITSSDFNDAMMEDFIYYLKDLNLMQSTISTVTDKVKYVLRRAKQEGYNINTSVFDVSVVEEQSSAVYINSKEIEELHKMTVRGNEQQVVKDLFLIGCLTGMRYSDYSQLTSKNIVGNNIYRKTVKTGEAVIVPMHRIVKEIVQKYNGNFPQYSNSLQNFNAIIKRICKRAGFNEKVFTERTRGHNIERRTVKKYELISSHTARRSFATNAYLAGILPAKIMLITGHKTESSFFNYIRINKTQNAKELSEHPFFR